MVCILSTVLLSLVTCSLSLNLLPSTTASPVITLNLASLKEQTKELINIPGMVCPIRVSGSVEVTLEGQKKVMPQVECITCGAPCGREGRGKCAQVIDNSSGQAWKRGCQCKVPVASRWTKKLPPWGVSKPATPRDPSDTGKGKRGIHFERFQSLLDHKCSLVDCFLFRWSPL